MKPLVYGAVLGLAWLLLALPYAPALPVGTWRTVTVFQPVTLAFAAGLLARPHLSGPRRWAR
jgi:hypothetical protein